MDDLYMEDFFFFCGVFENIVFVFFLPLIVSRFGWTFNGKMSFTYKTHTRTDAQTPTVTSFFTDENQKLSMTLN